MYVHKACIELHSSDKPGRARHSYNSVRLRLAESRGILGAFLFKQYASRYSSQKKDETHVAVKLVASSCICFHYFRFDYKT
jgi:hypothetical protein